MTLFYSWPEIGIFYQRGVWTSGEKEDIWREGEREREREKNLEILKLTSVFDKSGTLFIRIVIREYLVYDVIQRRINF